MPYQRSSVHSNGYSASEVRQNEAGSGAASDGAPTYLMEHLATFTVAKEFGIVYPADGMRRLLQLEKSNGIWSQKMQLRLDQNWVLIMDYESGAVMEKFPVALIQDPTAFTSSDPMEIYNNILVFTVGDNRSSNSRSEMHIFQCQSISAQDLVEDLKLLRVGKAPPARRARHIPPPPPTPPPEPPLNGVNVRQQVIAFNNAAHQSESRNSEMVGGSSSKDPATLSINDETSSTSSEKYERDVTILNHCFDDIEKFIARLQHAAAASRELERRRRNRKSKKKDMGDGMLTMRAKPPPEVEFVDIFQKFKLSFNLLAKLKAHIHDPNAPELVHFLFTPLALIVDASHDTHYGPNLPAKVVSPLLTREAVNLLINCVTSKETELWHSLGDAWLIPRDQWKGYVPPYHPVFMDGWSPDFPVLDDREHNSSAAEAKRKEEIRAAQEDADYGRDNEPYYGSDYFEEETGESNRYYRDRHERYSRDERERSQSPVSSDRDYPQGPPLPLRDITARSDISADSIERNGGGPVGPIPTGPGGPLGGDSQQRFERAQQRWLQELKAQGAKVVQVTYPRTANNDKELTVIRGEYLEILDDNRKWWKARNIRGQIAHVPHTIVTPPTTEVSDVFSNPLYARGYDRMDRETSSPGPAPPGASEWLPKQGKKEIDIPRPPPLPPAYSLPSSATASLKSPGVETPRTPRTPRGYGVDPLSPQSLEAMSLMDLLNTELRARLSKKPGLEIHRTPDVFIDAQSSAGEVQDWLKKKEFSAAICTLLTGMNGSTLLGLKMDALEILGKQHIIDSRELKRLDNQLTMQRSRCRYETKSKVELNAVLARARRKVEDIHEKDSEESTSA